MSTTLTYHSKPSTSLSNLSSRTECQIIEKWFYDSLIVTNLGLLENRVSSQIFEERQMDIILSDEDKHHFSETLKNPPKANQKLKKAFDHYYKIRSKDA
jgi:Protein of unknown function (DUF1778)